MLPVCSIYCVANFSSVQGVVVVVAGLGRLCWGFTISPECRQEVEQRAWCGGQADWLEVNTRYECLDSAVSGAGCAGERPRVDRAGGGGRAGRPGPAGGDMHVASCNES